MLSNFLIHKTKMQSLKMYHFAIPAMKIILYKSLREKKNVVSIHVKFL